MEFLKKQGSDYMNIEKDINDLTQSLQVSLKIKGVGMFLFRIKLALFIIKLGVKFLPIKSTVEIDLNERGE